LAGEKGQEDDAGRPLIWLSLVGKERKERKESTPPGDWGKKNDDALFGLLEKAKRGKRRLRR